MTDYLAPKYGGLLVFPEERYYGSSLPFGVDSFTPSNVHFLSTEQVLEDLVSVLNHVKAKYGAVDCPVVAFGGSYGGTLTTFLRASHPESVVGGLAASAPIGYYDKDGWEAHGVDEFTWSDIVFKVYNETSADESHQCMDYIHAAIDAVNAADVEELAGIFNVCDKSAFSPKTPQVNSDLFVYALEGLPQQNYPYKIGNLPGWPVNHTCGILTSSGALDGNGNGNGNENTHSTHSTHSALIAAAATITNMVLNGGAASCIPPFPDGGVGRVPGDGPGAGNWGYQSCTETLHQFSSRGVRDYVFDMERTALDLCDEYFGPTVYPDTRALKAKFGGWKLGDGLAGVTNLIWSNGLLDPWSGGGFYENDLNKGNDNEDGNHYFTMVQGAHHLDLRGPNDEDPEQVTEVREKEEKIIVGWIEDYVAKFTNKL